MKPLKIAFRADASLQIGTGHVMRCLTLAEALRDRGATCEFVCRELDGNLIGKLTSKNFLVHQLPTPKVAFTTPEGVKHAAWAEVDWRQDASETAAVLQNLRPDWLVLDHYSFDSSWEQTVVSDLEARLLVIDDLADRPHNAALILDQNLGRVRDDYAALAPDSCRILTGPHYALLRPEFNRLRKEAKAKRGRMQNVLIQKVMVSFGGVDLPNMTLKVLNELNALNLDPNLKLCVIMGSNASSLAAVKDAASTLPVACEVLVDTDRMANIIAESDLAIGAGGATSWERCCLGLPTLVIPIAANQLPAAMALDRSGAAVTYLNERTSDLNAFLDTNLKSLSKNPIRAFEMRQRAFGLADGLGTNRIVEELYDDRS